MEVQVILQRTAQQVVQQLIVLGAVKYIGRKNQFVIPVGQGKIEPRLNAPFVI